MPYSTLADDIYFCPEDGVAEGRHVFLSGCGLPEGWAGRPQFTLCELGFGTGLNCLLTWAAWTETCAPGARLDYLAVEGAPLGPDDLAAAHRAFPEFQHRAARLGAVLPPRQPGIHRRWLADDICLTLLYGPAEAMLAALPRPPGGVDAWYLDGFAPAKNPAMWSDDILDQVTRLSAPEARAATFTVAGTVRRSLAQRGFSVQKTPGFGRKREMLQALRTAPPSRGAEEIAASGTAPWFAPPPPAPGGPVAVIGGGIAGIALAQALHRRGRDVTLLTRKVDERPGPPRAVVMPRLERGATLPAQLSALAFTHAAAAYAALDQGWDPYGILICPETEEEAQRLRVIAASHLYAPGALSFGDGAQAAAWAGLELPELRHGALRIIEAGCVDPAALFRQWTADIEVRAGTAVHRIARHGARWQILGAAGERLMTASAVVLAAGAACGHLAPRAAWPLSRVAGTVLHMPATERSKRLKTVLAGRGQICPAQDGQHQIGATHIRLGPEIPDPFCGDTESTDGETAGAILAPWHGLGTAAWPSNAGAASRNGAWHGVRATTPDRLPLAGPVAAVDRLAEDYAGLATGRRDAYPPADYEPGLYVLSGLGARGFTHAPLLAEMIAAQIDGAPAPLSVELQAAVHPSRFAIRALKRGEAPAGRSG